MRPLLHEVRKVTLPRAATGVRPYALEFNPPLRQTSTLLPTAIVAAGLDPARIVIHVWVTGGRKTRPYTVELHSR